MNWEKGKSWVKKYRTGLAIVIMVVAAVAVYINILPNPFIWSEEEVIMNGTAYKDLRNIPKFFTTDYWLKEDPFAQINIFRPMRAVTFTIEYALWGLNPVPYHIFNILMHAATVVMVFFLIKKMTGNFYVGFLTAVFFAVHPIHTETITWTMSRDDIMGTLFPLVAWWFFIKRLENPRKQGLYLVVEMIFFGLGLLSREMAMIFPLLLGLYVVCFYPKKEWKQNLAATLPYWTVDFFYIFYHFYFWWEQLRETRLDQSVGLPFFNHIFLVAKTVGYYLWLMVVPVNLAADLYFPLSVNLRDGWVIGGVVILLMAGILAVLAFKKGWREMAFGLAFTVLAFLPVSNIIIVTGRPFGEQRAYLPSIGFCLLLAVIFARLFPKNRKTVPLLVILLLGAYSYKTVVRNLDWRSPEILWESNIKISPDSERAHRNLAGAYVRLGEGDKVTREYEAIAALQRRLKEMPGGKTEQVVDLAGKPLGAFTAPVIAQKSNVSDGSDIQISPEADIHHRLGESYLDQKDYKRAAYEYNVAIMLDPRDFYSYNELGLIYDMSGFSESAIFTFQKGIKVNPDYFGLHQSLAIAWENYGKYEEAVKENEKVMQLAPNYEQPYLHLAIIYAKYLGNKDKARGYWETYLTLVSQPDPVRVKEMEDLLR